MGAFLLAQTASARKSLEQNCLFLLLLCDEVKNNLFLPLLPRWRQQLRAHNHHLKRETKLSLVLIIVPLTQREGRTEDGKREPADLMVAHPSNGRASEQARDYLQV